MPAHIRSIRSLVFLCTAILGIPSLIRAQEPNAAEPETTSVSQPSQKKHRIRDIIIIGNVNTPRDAILNYIPYHVGEIFNPQKSGQLIRNLFTGLKRFRNVTLKADFVSDDLVDLYVVVEEKPLLKDIIFVGNKNLAEKEMREKIDFDIAAVDPAELKVFSEQIKKIYFEKGFQNVLIDTSLVIDEDGKSVATFTINEGNKSRIRRIKFEGNVHIPDKELRTALFTREEWVLSFMDHTGTFHPDRLEADKHMLEQYYQNRGYMQAKVIDVKVEPEKVPVVEPVSENPKNKIRAKYEERRKKRKERLALRGNNILHLTFVIEEGVPYTFSEIKAPGNDIITEEALLANIPIRPGQLYSRELITDTIKMLEFFWGNLGYIFAHVEPGMQVDEDNKTVSISFISDIGKQIKLNRMTIKGNKKTRDKVIRRRIHLREGGYLSQGAMEGSKNSVSNLGYFEQQDGVNWKVKRINEYEADLDLIVKEAKTGHANAQLSFGGAGVSMNSPAAGMVAKFSISDSNAMGTGTAVNAEFTWSKEETSMLFHLAQPWLFDKPISGAIDVYHKRPSYDQLRNVMGAINSKVTGGALTAGFITPPGWTMFNSSQVLFSLGVDSLHYDKPPQPNVDRRLIPPGSGIHEGQANFQYGTILSQEFTPGDYGWFANYIEQDKRNHPMHASRGQKWKITTKIAFPSFEARRSGVMGDPVARHLGFAKLFFDYTWFTPLINEQDLVFKLHLFFGLATPIRHATIPYGDLFHIGGDTSVRGFSYGQIGPQFLGDSIGGKKAFYLNAELIVPITPDLGMKGLVFYDGGTGWDNPYVATVNPALIMNNNFSYRHAVGVGIRMLRPMPVRVDWGFKLDPRPGENASQVHFGMNYDW